MENERITLSTPLSELMHSDIPENDELYHWKYLKREKVNGKWKYWYDLPSAKKDVESTLDKIKNTISSIFDKSDSKPNTASIGTSKSKTLTTALTTTKKSTSSFLSKVADRVKSIVHKYVAKVPTGNDEYRYFYSDKAYKAYLKGKEAVDNIISKSESKPIGELISDVAKNASKNFVSSIMSTGFGKAVYNTVLPVFTAIQSALQTPKSFAEMKNMSSDKMSTLSNDELQMAVNPDFDPYLYDYSYNCSFCTAAYDLRKRGYDVEAMPISLLEGPVLEDIVSWYDGAKAVSERDVEKETPFDYRYSMFQLDATTKLTRRTAALLESLVEHGEGARGHLALYWTQGGGHDVVWEIEDGEVVIRDCQTNEKYTSETGIMRLLATVEEYAYVRTDNLEPTEEVLSTVRNRKNKRK